MNGGEKGSLIRWGLIIGAIFGFLVAFGSFVQLIVVLFFTALGGVIAWAIQSRVSIDELIDRFRK